MEYMHRILQGLGNNPDFNYHPKCEKLKIINVCFADDILMFARGDVGSIQLLMKKVKDFSTATGLMMSIPKSRIYFGSVDGDPQRQTQQETGFEVGKMPF